MFDKAVLQKLQKKYNYDEKTIKALAKIVPHLIDYYGEDNEDLIIKALFDCEIIPCDSYQTISKIAKEKKLTKQVGMSPLGDIDLKRAEGVYLSNIEVSYNEETNTFNIDKIERTIVTSHTFNYDSPKGIEVLTYALCKLVKSYKDEYKLEENIITKRYGISEEKRLIVKDKDEIYLDIISDEGKGLEEGFTIHDTEQIVSNVLIDEYTFYDFDSVKTVADILKKKFNFRDKINDIEINGNLKDFEDFCNNNKEELSIECDKCLQMEQEMLISMFRQEKDELEKSLNKKLSTEVFEILMKIYQKGKKPSIN